MKQTAQRVLDELMKLFIFLAAVCGWISKITLNGF